MLRGLALVFACACGRVGFDELRSDGATAGDGTAGGDALTACASWSAWSTPALVPVINSSGIDWSPSISDDSLNMTFSSNRSGNHELYTTSRQSIVDDWDAPMPIAELTSMSDEEDDATLSLDLREMFFGKTQMFRTTRADLTTMWGPRTVVVPGDFDLVQGAELSSDDLRIYFNAGSPISDLYMMERPTRGDPFGPYAVIMPDPDPGADVGYPTLAGDELELYVASDHAGERDIYTSRRASRTDPFPQVTRVAELSRTGDADWDPEISFDGTMMWLATNLPGGSLDIAVAKRTCND